MTSNQIEYASLLETERHNQAYEDETNRHNLAEEDIKRQANVISEEKNQITATYNSQMVELQQKYNEWYAKFNEATTEQKLALEKEGNVIKQQLADTDQAYKIRMNELKAMEIGNAKAALDENKRHNTATELQAMAMASADWWFRDLEVKEKQRANDISVSYNKMWKEVSERGQDMTFDSNVISALTKSGLDLSIPGFKIGIKGLGPMTTLDLFNTIIGDRYGSNEEKGKREREGSATEQEESFTTGKGKAAQRLDDIGTGRAVQGKLR